METTHITSDKSYEVKLVYIVKHRLHFYRGNKSYPKHTQCLCFINGLIVGFGEVIKHENDIDNQNFAYKLATKKVINNINCKFIRKELWGKLFNNLNSVK